MLKQMFKKLLEHSRGYPESEGTVTATEDNYSNYDDEVPESHPSLGDASCADVTFDPQTRWPSPTNAYQHHSSVLSLPSTSSERPALVPSAEHGRRDYISRRSRYSPPPLGSVEAKIRAEQQSSHNAEASLAPTRESVTALGSERHLRGGPLCAFAAADDSKPAHDLLTCCRLGKNAKDKLTHSANADLATALAYLDSSRSTDEHLSVESVCCGGVKSQSASCDSIGQQGLKSHPRRNRTDSSWQKPPLVRQDDRKMTYVHSLIGECLPSMPLYQRSPAKYQDVAVSLIAFIWPGSQRPLRFHDATQGINKISLRYFIEQLLRRSYASHSTLQVALYYCILLRDSGALMKDPQYSASGERQNWNLLCGRRMFFASLMLAFKTLQDRNYSARAWSSISGLSIKDINVNEITFLGAIDYRTFVHETTYSLWQRLVHRCADQIKTGRAIPWPRLQSAMREQRTLSVYMLEQSSAARPTDGIAFPTRMHDRDGGSTPSHDAKRLFKEKSQTSANPSAAPPRRQTVVDRSVGLPKKAEKASSAGDWVHRAGDESSGDIISQTSCLDGSDTPGRAVLTRPWPSDARSMITPHPLAQVDLLPPFNPSIEKVAEWTPIPMSPGEKEAVAPPAPRPGTMQTPPDVSEEEVPKDVEMSQCFQQSARDVDSGYESSSPGITFQTDSNRELPRFDSKSVPSSSNDTWDMKILVDDHVASQNPSLQESVRTELSSGTAMAVYSKTIITPPCDDRDVSEIDAALHASRTLQPSGCTEGDERCSEDELSDEFYPHFDFDPVVRPIVGGIVTDSATCSPDESTYYEENLDMVEVLEEQALAHVDHRQNKGKNSSLPIRARSKRDYNTYSASHGESLANAKSSRSASKKIRTSEATLPSRRQRNRIVTC